MTRASIAWVPQDHDETRVRAFYEQFYRIARRYSGLTFAPAQAGKLELRYNDVHRRRSDKPDKIEFIAVMTERHSTIFGITPADARFSAEQRVLANNTVDRINSKQSTNVEKASGRHAGSVRSLL
ncbi:MAG: hypothetical protein H0X24_23110 [Ktedonobacterales bacterium]|nr:hypothetical protein [Ktedonobacterales bacterium]